MVEKTVSSEKENKITIEMWRKLLATKIVAKSFLGFESNLLITFALERLDCSNSERFFWDKEKSATSDAATIEQQKSDTTIPIIPKNKLVSIFENNLKLGSRSKFNKVS